MARSAFARIAAVIVLSVLSSSSQDAPRRRPDMSEHWDRGPPPGDPPVEALQQRRLELSTEFFFVPTTRSSTTSTSSSSTPEESSHDDVVKSKCVSCGATPSAHLGIFRDEAWVIPALALSIVTMLMIAAFEIFVLCKACQTIPSRRHLFLGQMLLLGLFSAAGLASVAAMSPTPSTCAIVRFGTGVSYALIFASLLVKSVFLISLNGGVYLPAPYQGLLLFFAVLVQVAVGVQWLVTSPPAITTLSAEKRDASSMSDASKHHQRHHHLLVTADDVLKTDDGAPGDDDAAGGPVSICQTSYTDALLSLTYVVFLLAFVAVLAFKSRSIRDNYREATYIGLSVACSVPAWLVWTLSGFVVSDRHKDACVAFGLAVSSVMVFLIMFMPKGRQLAAMGKEGLYVEDREDRFSSLSRTGSGYSPSFFHFKPVKYAEGGGAVVAGATQKSRHHTVTTVGGDSAAHFGPAPPSYSRIFHCYPNPSGYLQAHFAVPGSVFVRSDDGNMYTTLEPTLSTNPNVYFQRGTGVHPGMMY